MTVDTHPASPLFSLFRSCHLFFMRRVVPMYAIVVIMMVILDVSGSAQSRDIRFEQVSLEQGLSSKVVQSILQDRQGFMWFGTEDGLDRYDGYAFRVFRDEYPRLNSISGDLITRLYEDRSGGLWIGTLSRGLNRYERTTSSFTHYLADEGDSASPGSEIHAIYEDKSGVLWVGTNHGLKRFNSQSMQFTSFIHSPRDPRSLSNNFVGAICEDRYGVLWVGTGNYNVAGGGLNRFDRQTNKCTHFVHDPSIANSVSDDWITAIYEDTYGSLWIATNNGLDRFDRSSESFVHYRHDPKNPGSLSGNYVKCIGEDQTGALWIGTWAAGLNRMERNTGRFVYWQSDSLNSHALRGNNVVSVYWDRSGMLWVGTTDGGVFKANETTGRFSRTPKESEPFEPLVSALSGVFVNSVCADKSGSVWIGTIRAGIRKFTVGAGVREIPLEDEGKGGNGIDCIIEDRAGILWFGTDSGLGEFDPVHGAVRRYVPHPENLTHHAGNLVRTLYEDSKGELLVGTSGAGLKKFDRKEKIFAPFLSDPADSMSLYGLEITALEEDRYGSLWIGTGDGVCRYDSRENKVSWYHADTADVRTLYSNTINAIHEDAGGTLWVASAGALHRFDRAADSFVRYTVENGLLSMSANGIQEDGHGRLWLGTGKGLSVFDPGTERFRNYDMDDGLQGVGFTRFPCKNRDGVMFFGRMDGLTVFQPDSLKDDAYLAPIVITSFKKFDKDARFSDEVRLTHSEDFFSFDFAIMDFRRPGKNQYAYKLDGFDHAWIYSGPRHYAAYTHLDPGTYHFKTKGSNSYGVWNEEGTSVAVIVVPPFWETWWFRMLGFIAVLFTTGGSIRYIELKKIKKRITELENERALERERTRISQDMHDEVGSSLSEIAILSELAKKKPEESGVHMQEISDLAAEVIDNVSEIVWAMNPQNDTLDNFVAHSRRYSSKYLTLAGIKCAFSTPDAIPANHLSAEIRRNLFLVLKEALHNVVKHSRASEVSINVTIAASELAIIVKDNGNGFGMNERVTSGNGLTNMRKRAQSIGGTFTIESEPGHGTQLKIAITWV